MMKTPYTPTTAFQAFGRLMNMSEVQETVPLFLLVGGPKDGWVYDARHIERREATDDPNAIQYEDVSELGILDDGRLVRIFAPAAPTAGAAAPP